ncbi:flagellar export protein FliJ [Rubripirellula reticaptiva]|uniref:Flagellar FliJ protein n=1 Tax=Rubripirellula reticaptiva TaxID=2528013 RepID=A0A5C6FCY5_9BACT|nr:flagellar export protein FliJ [Rubripirellula reticaptiva]TWU57519.1 flagellar biosynthesis chaperone [Rubripirellula reticaptiva]
MAFNFRFQSILDLRCRQRDEAGAAVGQANQAIARIDEQTEQVEAQRLELRTQNNPNRIGHVSVEGLLSVGRYEMQLQADLAQLAATRAELVRELDRRQLALIEAEAEVKRFEKLSSNERVSHQTKMNVREQADADERSTQAYILARRVPNS